MTAQTFKSGNIVELPTGTVGVVIQSNSETTDCRYLGNPVVTEYPTRELRFLAESYAPFQPELLPLESLIEARNKEAADYFAELVSKPRTKKAKSAQKELHDLIMDTPPDKLQQVLKERGLIPED